MTLQPPMPQPARCIPIIARDPGAKPDDAKGRAPTGRWALFILLFLTATGCQAIGEPDYGSFNDYGKVHGQNAGYASVDGLSGLATLFRDQGRALRRAKRISPLIDRYDTIVWCPNRMTPPSNKVIDRLEQWLTEGNYRSIIFVPPGFRGKKTLMKQQLAMASPRGREREKALRRYNEYLSSDMPGRHGENYLYYPYLNSQRAGECQWFSQQEGGDSKITDLQGTWSGELKVEDSNLYAGVLDLKIKEHLDDVQDSGDGPFYFGRQSWQRESETLLEHSGGVLLSRIFCPGNESLGQVFVFSNGSALMNLGLANKENRKIAGQLVDQTYGSVMLLESGPMEIEVRETYAPNESGWEWLTRAPICNIVPYFLLLSVVAFFTAFPIHGRPQRIDLETKTSFGDHIRATGQLLKRQSNRAWALDVVRRYKQRSGDK